MHINKSCTKDDLFISVIIMYISITKSGNNKNIYIVRSFRTKSGKTSSTIYKKLGTVNELLPKFSGDYAALLEWAKNEAKKETINYENNIQDNNINLTLNSNRLIDKDEVRTFNIGYIFLKHIYSKLRIDDILQNISSKHNIHFNISSILANLIYTNNITAPILDNDKFTKEDTDTAFQILIEESNNIKTNIKRNLESCYPQKDVENILNEVSEYPNADHNIINYIGSLLYCILEKLLNNKYTIDKIKSTINNMNVTKLPMDYGYVPSYTRTDLIDSLHSTFNINTDYEIISKPTMKNLLKIK